MAMDGVDLAELWEPYQRDGRTYIRVRHDVTRSARLEAYRVCVGDALRGHRYHTGDAAEDEREVRAAFREAAHACRASTATLGGR